MHPESGTRAAGAQLISQHNDIILAECMKALRARPVASMEPEDVVQDAQEAVLRAAPQLCNADKPGAMARVVARRAARRSVERASRAELTIPQEELERCPA